MDLVKGGYKVNFKNVLVKMSDGSLIHGKVNVGDNYHCLSDKLRHSTHPFMVVSEESPENPPKIFIVNKSHIVWAETQD